MIADAVRPDGRWTKRTLIILVVALTVLLFVLVLTLFALLPKGRSAASKVPAAGLRPILALYGPGVGSKPLFDGPMAAAFGKDGRIYVADTGNNRVVVFDRHGRYLFQFGGFGVGKPAAGGTLSWKPGLMNYPTDITVDEDGIVYVADFRNDQIQVFDAEGHFLRVFPDRTKVVGKGASGQDGTGIAVTSLTARDEKVYATDTYQVVVFDTSGRVLTQLGKPGRGPEDLDHPNGIAVGPDATLFVSDSNHNRVIALAPPGRLKWSVGTLLGDVTHDSGGPLEVPRGLTLTDDGALIVADAMASRLVRLTATGVEDGVFGQRGSVAGELDFPTDVDSEGDRLVVAEKGNDRVQVLSIEE